MSGIIDNILSDAEKLRAMLAEANRLGSFERQLLSQLFAMNENERVLEKWLADISEPLKALQEDHIAAKARVLELEGKTSPAVVKGEVLSPVDEITGRLKGTAG